jgi:ferrochelatase
MKQAVLMLAYGTPDDLSDMEAYLLDIRGGRPTPPELVEEMTGRYRRIGGSPLTRLTLAQADTLEKELRRRGSSWPVFVGMRHWMPRIKEAVAAMHRDGVTEVVAIVMAPHYSSLSIGRYRGQVEEAISGLGGAPRVRFVESWWEQPKFLHALQDKIAEGLRRLEDPARVSTKLVFTAHSLPARILQAGDPYEQQLLANARTMADRFPGVDWTFAFQSAGASAEPWLGPSLEETIPALAETGYQQILVAPIGFVCDHVEILYDLDIEARALAEQHRLRLERTESMNTDPVFIQAVADAVLDSYHQPSTINH